MISATLGQDCCWVAIAEKSTGCASTTAAKTCGLGNVGGCLAGTTPFLLLAVSVSMARIGSGAAKPYSGQSSTAAVKKVLGGAAFCCGPTGTPCDAGGLLRVSATKFSGPVFVTSDVNSAMKDNCHCWWADGGGGGGGRGAEKGGEQWLVVCEKHHPSSRNQK